MNGIYLHNVGGTHLNTVYFVNIPLVKPDVQFIHSLPGILYGEPGVVGGITDVALFLGRGIKRFLIHTVDVWLVGCLCVSTYTASAHSRQTLN